nr:MAG TPA: hypothetical protein [Bacteriophage sp.]
MVIIFYKVLFIYLGSANGEAQCLIHTQSRFKS